ncbi:hypothetical protein Gogos_005505, partial [Gossypium gossypioides]|nr:hypothetical protein [Gossypium gossypioides]
MCGSLEYRHLGAWIYGSLEHHRHLDASDVRESRAVPTHWCLDVQKPRRRPVTLVLGCAGASDSIGTLVLQMGGLQKNDRIGFGTIIRDEEGFVLGGGGGFKEGRVSVEEAECMAFEESINVARRLNLKENVLFETDHVGLVNRLNNLVNDVTVIGARIRNCTVALNSFKSASLIWTERECNNVAHLICKKMCREARNCLFEMDYPSEIHTAVICD